MRAGKIYLPPDYDYQDFSRHDDARNRAAPETSSSSFSILDYSRMEQASKAQAKVEALRDVSEARRQLASGNVREASASFNRAKTRIYAKRNGERRRASNSKKICRPPRPAISSTRKVISVTRNAGQIARTGKLPPRKVQQPDLSYDNAAAEQQSAKLQQAQEIVAAQVQPLAREPAGARRAFRLHPGLADGNRQTDDDPNAGRQHQGRQLADARPDGDGRVFDALGIGRHFIPPDFAHQPGMTVRLILFAAERAACYVARA